MNNLFVKQFNDLNLSIQLKVLMEIYRTGTLSLDTLREIGVDQGSQLLKELHMIVIKVLLNKVEPAVERDIIRSLEASNPELAEDIKRAMFTFEDVVILPDATIACWLEKCDDAELVVALSESGKYVRNRILQIMPSERAKTIRQQLTDTLKPSLDEVYRAKTHLVEILQQLEMAQEIKIDRLD